jgi:hypothetical protein
MKYTGAFRKMKRESAERRARARAIRKIDRELVDLSYQRIDLSYDLLRLRVHGLPPG